MTSDIQQLVTKAWSHSTAIAWRYVLAGEQLAVAYQTPEGRNQSRYVHVMGLHDTDWQSPQTILVPDTEVSEITWVMVATTESVLVEYRRGKGQLRRLVLIGVDDNPDNLDKVRRSRQSTEAYMRTCRVHVVTGWGTQALNKIIPHLSAEAWRPTVRLAMNLHSPESNFAAASLTIDSLKKLSVDELRHVLPESLHGILDLAAEQQFQIFDAAKRCLRILYA